METGGFLGFGLQHEYPLDPKAGLSNLLNCLKGSDAVIQRVCSLLSLQTMLRVIYGDEDGEEGPYFVLVKDVVDYSDRIGYVETSIGQLMTQCEGGKLVAVTGPIADEATRHGYQEYDSDDDSEDQPEGERIDVDWVTDLTKLTVAKTPYITYGNEAHMGFVSHPPSEAVYGQSNIISSILDVRQCLPSCARRSA
jgi:hypothetical protein